MEETLNSLSTDYLNLLVDGQAFSDVTLSASMRRPHPPAHRLRPRSAASSSTNSSAVCNFLYSGRISFAPLNHEQSAVDLVLDVLNAARSFDVEQLVMLAQKELESIVENASIEDVTKVLLASRNQELHHLWTTCLHLVADSDLSPEILTKTLPIDVVANIEDLRIKSSLAHHSSPFHQTSHYQIHRMRCALDSSDVELVKRMVMTEGLNLDDALALHYAVQHCSRDVVKALLELGMVDVNCANGLSGKTPLHVAAGMVSPDMVSVLLDHHADPTVKTLNGMTPVDILRSMNADFLFEGAVPRMRHVERNKVRFCLELVQSAAMVMSREASAAAAPPMARRGDDESRVVSLSLDSRMVQLNLGMESQCSDTFTHHHLP
ncbi:uncharacterized protein A4U43_UnF1780 [Asparagus officinalis]|uniref:Regulatory protein NPR central domain-containing protein n=1 Tax=Asparagus officinalis TaxID=4686 RepID=A0A1R3L7F8_ASPOF|nr:uncharacterized protein A4U43_UnF1780 [Asparagus officinalis]